MAKFNDTKTIRTTNKSGHVAYSMQDKEKLITQVLTSFVNEEKFYGDNTRDMIETIKRVVVADPQFISNLAVFARREFNMRSVSHVLTTYLAHEPEGKPFVRETLHGVCLRGDDPTEIMAFYLKTFGKPVPNSLKKGIGDVLVTFDEYTLAKYKGEEKAVKMRDLLCLCRPTPKDEAQSGLFKKCLEGELETPLTWESELSAKGNNAETWEKLIDSGKVGYMALLRNLRNIINANPKNIAKVYDRLCDPIVVRKSRQLPFRFLSAYKSITGIGSSMAFDALETAVRSSCENIPKLKGLTVIAIDVSGSMTTSVSGKSDVSCVQIGAMLGLIANRICEDSIVYTFSDGLKKIPVGRNTSILENAIRLRTEGGTNMTLPFMEIMRNKIKPDRVIVLSDNECNRGTSWYTRKTVGQLAQEARAYVGKDFWVHAIDLAGYGTQQFTGQKTNILSGWSEKMLDLIRYAEIGEETLAKRIEKYDWHNSLCNPS